MKTFLPLVLLAALAACPSPNAPPTRDADATPPPPSLDGGATAAAACANLAALGCQEGQTTKCEAVLGRVVAARLLVGPDGHPFDLTCPATARTKAEVRACGPITCP